LNVEILSVCDFAQDALGKLNVFGAFDAITAQDFPTVHPLMCVAVRVRFQVYELGDHNVRLEIKNADGDNLVPPLDGTLSVNGIGGDSACANMALNIANLKLEREGSWKLTLTIDGQERSSIPLFVRKLLQKQV
jgi:hypothetical protein